MPKKVFSFELDEKEREKLRKLAYKKDCSIGDVVRESIRFYLENTK